jgi:hypothetical protein
MADPQDNDDISCHLQQVGMGSLLCRAARRSGNNTTNEVTPEICFNCLAGNIYREVGCDSVLPRVRFLTYAGGCQQDLEGLFCTLRKRDTTLEYCRQCNLVVAETTRQIVTVARGLFEAQGFYSAYQDIEKAREAIRDGNFANAITRSIDYLESTMRICHEKLEMPLPEKKQVSDLWKSTRNILQFDEIDSTNSVVTLMNALRGVITDLGGLRNSLSDAHGKV